ncbi:MAG: hypothetical protein M0R32_11120 [Candidatus Cloacimonetes bacterium]|jgi:hypothetical protein|nr:hypothetical protein [Candidatus Cloacimonadota bacterium]
MNLNDLKKIETQNWRFSEAYTWGCGGVWIDAVYKGRCKYHIRFEKEEELFYPQAETIGYKNVWDAVMKSLDKELKRENETLDDLKDSIASLPNPEKSV